MNRHRARRAAAVAMLAFAATGASTAATHPFPRFTQAFCHRADFTSAGTHIRAELCRASRDASIGRAVVVLHGCGGFSTLDHRVADTLPLDGISTLYVDYFAPTPPLGNKGWCSGWHHVVSTGQHATLMTRWLGVVGDAVTSLTRTPGISPGHIGLVGWSLGGGLAVAAAQADRRVHALAAFSTGSFAGAPAHVSSLPPLLLLSGGTTDAIPLKWTLVLYRAARAAGAKVSLFVYPHGSHSWPRRQGTVGIAHAASFLRANL
ncbi:MAG: dienelactone hydrolase family protein [Gaiellaceae bacterium]